MIAFENSKLLQPPWSFVKPGVTEEEYFAWADEDSHFELIDGVLYVNSPESRSHNDHRQFIQVLLRQFCEETGFGLVFDANFPLHLASCRIFEPDIVVVSRRRSRQVSEKQVEAPVELVVEVLSPHNRPHDLALKRPLYREARIGELWIVDGQNRQVEVDRLRGRAYRSSTLRKGRLESGSVPGFWIQVEWLWQSPLPSTLAKSLSILGRA
jgi:Uma2 family endonuclease